MKRLIRPNLLFIMVLSVFTFVQVNAQKSGGNVLRGTQSFDHNPGDNYYTKVHWSISYSFEIKDDNVIINFYAPKIYVADDARYGRPSAGFYRKSDLGINNWPERNQRPANMQVTVNITHSGKSYQATSDCLGDGTCNEVSVTSLDNAMRSASPLEKQVYVNEFNVVSVESMWYNGGPDDELEDIIEARKREKEDKIKYDELIKQASRLEMQERYQEALETYQQAAGYTKNLSHVNINISRLKEMISEIEEEHTAEQADDQGSKTRETEEKDEEDDYQSKVLVKMFQAENYEKEGDRYHALGSLFFGEALKQYQMAQETYYTQRVQDKINGINSMLALAKGLNDGFEALDDVSHQIGSSLDAVGIPRAKGGVFSYERFEPKYHWDTAPFAVPQAWSASFDYGLYRIFALEGGFTYMQSPTFNISVVDNNGNDLGHTVYGSFTAAGMSVGAGLAWPHRLFNLHAVYKVRALIPISASNHSKSEFDFSGFEDAFEPGFFNNFFTLRLGGHFIIPKTRIGIGGFFTMNTINGEKLLDDRKHSMEKNGRNYYLGEPREAKYKFNRVGVSVFFMAR